MTPEELLQICQKALPGTVPVSSWGERGLFYNPEGLLKRGVYVLTVKERDGENDRASGLDREGVYRLNLGLRRETFEGLFGSLPKRPPKGGTVAMDYDFTALDRLLPHPVYAWMGWICVLNPAPETLKCIGPLLREAYEYAEEKYRKRIETARKKGEP